MIFTRDCSKQRQLIAGCWINTSYYIRLLSIHSLLISYACFQKVLEHFSKMRQNLRFRARLLNTAVRKERYRDMHWLVCILITASVTNITAYSSLAVTGEYSYRYTVLQLKGLKHANHL